MFYPLEKWYRQLQRFYNRNRFIVWLFGMSRATDKEHRQGLIILQIDGLSHTQIQRALESGSMPFLAKLLANEHYSLHSLYAGVPSSTPAAQGELLYGVRGCVPAFKFKRPQDTRSVHMLDLGVAADIEKNLEAEGHPLLTNGSAYSDLFTGGAAESSFCASSIGWSSIVPSSNIFKMLVFALLNIVSIARVVVLVLFELVLALVDFVRGVVGGRNLFKELTFVPVRVGISILLRELVTIGVKLDAARGLPVIHANFLGYDEQAHRRGPGSKFAHWSLKGIDNAIARIWRSARYSEYRDYDLWVYSDHGQEATGSYPLQYKRSIHDAIRQTVSHCFSEQAGELNINTAEARDTMTELRIKLLGGRFLSSLFNDSKEAESDQGAGVAHDVEIAVMGPLGFIYIERSVSLMQQQAMAQDLVEHRDVPMAMVADFDIDGDRIAHVFCAGEHWQLPLDSARVFGAKHPYLDEVCQDTLDLCHHPLAGKLTFFGWRPDRQALTFRIENGAHAGPGEHETHAFALLPEDTRYLPRDRSFLRFIDLHKSAHRILDTAEARIDAIFDDKADDWRRDRFNAAKPEGCVRVMTYNVHSCIGVDGKINPRRIARVIARYNPDIVALQEVDIGRAKSMHMDQTTLLAAELNMDIHYHPVRCIGDEQFGNAVLSTHPIRLVQARELSAKPSRLRNQIKALSQPRGGLQVEVDIEGIKLQMVTTHLGLTPEERRTQVQHLLADFKAPDGGPPTVICGDFNAAPNQNAYLQVADHFSDVQSKAVNQGRVPRKTFPSRYPRMRIDHMFVDPRVKVRNVVVPTTHLTKVASDHLPVIADLDISALVKETP